MKRTIGIAVVVVIAGLAMTAGAAELSGVKAADVAALSEAGGIPRVSEPAMAENHRKAAVSGTTEFYGNGYSRWQAESQGKALEELAMYTASLKKAGITVRKAEVCEVEGYLHARVTYDGSQVLFRSNGTALTVTGARSKMNKEAADLRVRGAEIIKLEAWRGHDEWSSGGAYAIEYFLSGTTRDRSMQALMKDISAVLASGPLPGGCALEVNAFRASAFQPGTGDNLNVGIMKGGEYTDILMVGVAQAAASSDGMKYAYESVSCPSDNWVGRCEKDSFTLATDAGGRITSVSIERAKEKSGLLRGGWKVTSSVVCR